MTLPEYIEKLQKRKEALEAWEEQGYFIVASTIHADQVDRIFTQGLASDGSKIGGYQTAKPLYVNPANAPVKFAPEGKTGKKEHDNGKPYKTKYFASYAAFRSNQGRRTDTVNLELFGRLKSEYENGLRRGEGGSWISGLQTDESIDKAIGNQKKYNKAIFSLSEQEREKYKEVLLKELNNALNNA